MNGPQVVCACCGAPTSIYAPLCEECARNYVALVGEIPSCELCREGFPLEHGMHKTKSGGHAGRCSRLPQPAPHTDT
jgi:hypothetical protein